MASPAELSSLVTAIEELEGRVTAAADEFVGGPRDDAAVDLYDVERALRTARRKLAKVVDALR